MTTNQQPETYTVEEILAAFVGTSKDDWGVEFHYDDTLLSALRRARHEAQCAPDCRERANCPEVGTPGHSQCGICPTHEMPRHQCGGSVWGSTDTHEEI